MNEALNTVLPVIKRVRRVFVHSDFNDLCSQAATLLPKLMAKSNDPKYLKKSIYFELRKYLYTDHLFRNRHEDYKDVARTQTFAIPLELRECLDLCAVSAKEKQIIYLRYLGHTDREISVILEIPCSTLCRMRRVLFERFKRLWHGELAKSVVNPSDT